VLLERPGEEPGLLVGELAGAERLAEGRELFVDASDPLLRRGFFEKEIHRVTRQYGAIAHVWSTYESRATEDGPVLDRGINSIELHFDGTRWWIAGAQWFTETKEHPIPAEYLQGGK
jgi:hypothetical protein